MSTMRRRFIKADYKNKIINQYKRRSTDLSYSDIQLLQDRMNFWRLMTGVGLTIFLVIISSLIWI